MDAEAGFAAVYDLLYDEPSFLAVRTAFLAGALARAGRASRVLDAGCGTGLQGEALARHGHSLVGLDRSRAMLARARGRLPCLIQADLRRPLPLLSSAFDGVISLESPLAYLLADADLAGALAEFHRVLRPGGVAVIDVFDYRATLGEHPPPRRTQWQAPWGTVNLRETHGHDQAGKTWRMTQSFTLSQAGAEQRFTVEHIFRERPADTYAAALEAAGFEIEELWPAYPGSPANLRHEQRLIFVAHKRE